MRLLGRTPTKPLDSDIDDYPMETHTYTGHLIISQSGEDSFSLTDSDQDFNNFHSATLTPRRDHDGIIYIPKDLVTPPKFGAKSAAPARTSRRDIFPTVTSIVTASANSGNHTPRRDASAATVPASPHTPRRDVLGVSRVGLGVSSVGTPRRQDEAGETSVGTPRHLEIEPGRIVVANGPERLVVCVYACVCILRLSLGGSWSRMGLRGWFYVCLCLCVCIYIYIVTCMLFVYMERENSHLTYKPFIFNTFSYTHIHTQWLYIYT